MNKYLTMNLWQKLPNMHIWHILCVTYILTMFEAKIYSSNNPKLKKLAAFNKDCAVVIAEEKKKKKHF